MLRDAVGTLGGRAPVTAAGAASGPWAYPTDWSALLADASVAFGPFDSAGVPLWLVRGRPEYTPSRIAGFALACWSAGDTDARRAERWLGAARWFATQPDGQFWYPFDVGALKAPWLSCIGQGQGISVLCRAHLVFGGDEWLASAALAARPLLVPLESGGLLGRLPSGAPFFEEYPGHIPHVLNGCLHAWVGLDELTRLGAAPRHAPDVLASVAEGLAASMQLWDVNGWSSYTPRRATRVPNVNTLNYHIVHSALLEYVASRSGHAALEAQAVRWRASSLHATTRLVALSRKIAFRVSEGW
jgi:heparosan-N-sulfate-glucuronate 5-epimerase